jgi:hypothetical protein
MAKLLLETGTDDLLQEDGTFLLASVVVFDDIRQDILDGIDSAQSEATGWDALRSTIPVTAVVRTSGTVVTITLPALATYNITANETLTVTVPASAVVGAAPIVATPTIEVAQTLIFYAEREHGSIRPFPFLPSSAPRRVN